MTGRAEPSQSSSQIHLIQKSGLYVTLPTCGICGAVLLRGTEELHTRWHQEAGAS